MLSDPHYRYAGLHSGVTDFLFDFFERGPDLSRGGGGEGVEDGIAMIFYHIYCVQSSQMGVGWHGVNGGPCPPPPSYATGPTGKRIWF